MRVDRIAAPVLGAVLGLVAFSISLGLEIADPWHVKWVLVESDRRIHFLGWHMFRHDVWRWPPGAIGTFGYPVGTSLAYTDSIPALAFPFKLIGPLLDGDVQYLGLWLLMSHVLQGFFAVLLLRTVTTNRAIQVLGAALFVMSPPLIFRFGHAALTAHWLLLASLWVYFSVDRFRPGVTARWAVAGAVAALTHPYIAMMVLVLATAHHASLAMAGRSAPRPAVSLALVVGVFASVFWLVGYFVIEGSSDIQAPGLGVYSMNLLALIMPREQLSPWAPGLFEYATNGQYEGYAYLGAGAMLLLIIVIATAFARRRVGAVSTGALLRHAPLALGCTVLVIMALSPKVTAGGRVLFEYDAWWWGPLTLFRASGRLFWPVFYLLLFGIVAAVARWYRPRAALVLLAGATLLQAADVRGMYVGLRDLRNYAWDTPLQSEVWSAAAPHYRHLVLVPTNLCDAPAAAVDYTPFALLAGRAGLTLNGGFAARFDTDKVKAYCADAGRRFGSGDVRDDELYVVKLSIVPALKARTRAPLTCLTVDGYGVCFTTESYRRWHHLYDVARQTLPPQAEIERFRAGLESIYRDELRRPAIAAPRPPSVTAEWLTRYVSNRLHGCSHEDAMRRVVSQATRSPELPFCGARDARLDAIPSNGDTIEFRQRLDVDSLESSEHASAVTHVDAEGEAVWTREYLRLRLEGRSESDAMARIHSAIRAITAGS